MNRIELTGNTTLTVEQCQAGIVVETQSNSECMVIVSLPALSAFPTGTSGKVIIISYTAYGWEVYPNGNDLLTLNAISENARLVSPESQFAMATLVVGSAMSGWIVTSVKSGETMETIDFWTQSMSGE